jgi:anoctamin-10
MVPILTTALSSIATRLTDFENYEHECSYEAAMTQKVFIFNFICSYVPVFLTAFVYVPFGATIVPRLDVFGLMAPSEGVIAENIPAFEIDPDRLRKQVVYFAVTQQLVNFATETIVPIFMRKIFKKAKEIQCKRTGKGTAYINDLPEEKAFLERVRNEAELDLYNVTDDLRQMCMQVCFKILITSLITQYFNYYI